MGNLFRTYTKLMQSFLPNSYGAYPPAANFCNPGEYGKIHEGTFTLLGSLQDFAPGISYTPTASPPEKGLTHVNKDYITLTWKISGGVKVPVEDLEGLGNVEAGIDFVFKDSNEIIFTCDALIQNSIDANPGPLFQSIKPILKANKWNHDWVIIQSNWVASNFVFISATDKGAKFSLTGTASGLYEFVEGSVTEQFAIQDDQNLVDKQIGYEDSSTIAFSYVKL